MNLKSQQNAPNKRAFWIFYLLFAILAISIFFAWRFEPIKSIQWPSLNNPFVEEPIPVGYYKVLSVADGDTIVIDMNGIEERIRLVGVDTPETHHPELPVQCFGEAASTYTKTLLEGKSVRLEADSQGTNRDRYQRLLRYVYTNDNTLVNLSLIEQGYGFAYLGFPFDKMDKFAAAEKSARQNNKGLWSGCNVDEDNRNPQTIYPEGQLVP
ncbi:MAG: thermonuclease family protein [bacterium]|nr:thermonuclease family protein [bacterium]